MSAYFVDGLRNEEPENAFWRIYANGADGEGVTLSYSFMSRVPLGTYQGYGDPAGSFEPLDSAARSLMREAMARISAVADVRFVEAGAATADLLLGSWDIPGDIAGYAEYPTWSLHGGGLSGHQELWLDREGGTDSLPVMLHELGHVLGLDHSFEGAHVIPEAQDGMLNTVMSYTWDSHPDDLGVFDVAALQSVYGPARRRMGDDTYTLGEDKVIWDGGGRDRITAGAADEGVTLRLGDGSWSHIGARAGSLLAPDQVWLGHFSLIEDARGSRFADRIAGNASGNWLDGGEGADRLEGFGGRDGLVGGAGRDLLLGGGGDDRLRGADGADELRGNDGADRLAGGRGGDLLSGGEGADVFILRAPEESGRTAGRDIVLDFGTGDRLDLSALDLAYRGALAFTGAGREVRVEAGPDRALLLIDIDGDRWAESAIGVRGTSWLREGDLLL